MYGLCRGSRECNDSAGKIHTTQLNARLPPRNLLTCTFLLDRISSSCLHWLLHQHVGAHLKTVVPLLGGGTCSMRHHPGSIGHDDRAILFLCSRSPSSASVHFPASLIEILCTVQHSAALLICAVSQRGRQLDHFLLAWKCDDFSVRCMSCW